MAHKAFKTLGIAAAFATAISGLSPANDFSLVPEAQAQTTARLPSQMAQSECASRQAVIAGLTQEGQQVIIAAEAKKVVTGGFALERNVFTSNRDLSHGYHLVQNPGGEYCKAAELNNIKILRGDRDTIDQRAYMQPASHAPSGTLNYTINSAFRNFGEFPMFQANTENNNGFIITVTGQPNSSNGSGHLGIARLNGEAVGSLMLVNPQYSQVAREYLNQPVQTASLSIR